MIQDISVRFQDIEINKIYTIATYLDPRYKLKFFTGTSAVRDSRDPWVYKTFS